MKSKQIYINNTKLIRTDDEYHKSFKILSAIENRSIKSLAEEAFDIFLDLHKERLRYVK